MTNYHPRKWSKRRHHWTRMPRIWQRLFWRHVERRAALFACEGTVVAVGPAEEQR